MVSSTRRFYPHCKTGLKTNGLLAVATFGEDNLKEVRHITNIGLNYPTLSQWQNWLEQDFELLWCDDVNVILEFDTPLDVLKHLKYTGVTATNQKNWTRKNLNKFIDDYLQAFSLPSGKVRLTYHPLFLSHVILMMEISKDYLWARLFLYRALIPM